MLQVPIEIAFHGIDKPDWAEDQIRDRAAKLERLYDRLHAVRVAVELPHKRTSTNIPHVRIEMSVPGQDLVVNKEPHKPEAKYNEPDLLESIRDAFAAAERRLKSFKARISGDVKEHEEEFRGQVSEVIPEEDHGFLLDNVGSSVYFHRNSLLDMALEDLSRGDAVHYIFTVGETGPIARTVWSAPTNTQF